MSEYPDREGYDASKNSGREDGVYACEQTRRGVPLHYISEKLETALKMAHGIQGDEFARHAVLRDGLKAFLALHNMLNIWSDELVDALLKMPPEKFESWLEKIVQEGSLL